jgi:hypothetical protein
MNRLLATLALLLAVTSCAAPPEPKTAGIKTIGIVSAIGDTVAYQRVGAVPSHSETTSGDASAWQLDDFVTGLIKAKLSSTYTIVPIEVDHPALNGKRDGITASVDSPIAPRLQTALKPGTPPVDAYLVVSVASAKDFIGPTTSRLTGLAIYRRAGSGLQIYAVCDLALIDAHSFRTIDAASLRLERDRMFGGSLETIERPYRRLDKSLARDTSWDQFTEAQQKLIKTAFQGLLRDSLDFTLKDMKLAP